MTTSVPAYNLFYIFIAIGIFLKFFGIALKLYRLHSREVCGRERVNLMLVRYVLCMCFVPIIQERLILTLRDSGVLFLTL